MRVFFENIKIWGKYVTHPLDYRHRIRFWNALNLNGKLMIDSKKTC